MQTVHKWITDIQLSENILYPPMGNTAEQRSRVASPVVDAVFVLGKGFIQYDNTPIGFCTDEDREQFPETRWILAYCKRGSLLYLFTLLLQATSNIQGVWINPLPYLSKFNVDSITLAK